MGIGFSLLFPSLALIVMNRVGEAGRGAAMGAFTAFFDVGVGLGAPLAGAVAALAGYPVAFYVAAGAAGPRALLGGTRPAGRAPAPPPAAPPPKEGDPLFGKRGCPPFFMGGGFF